MSIPVVDFSAFSLNVEDISTADLDHLSRDIRKAFTEVGFVFLDNTGITQAEVDRVMGASRRFFLQPDHFKKLFRRKTFPSCPLHGWIPIETERVNPETPGDLKESFNMTSLHPDIKWPSPEIAAGFQETQTAFFQRCKELSLRILKVMAHSLDLDPDVFLGAHRWIGTDDNTTTLRSLYYPPVKRELAKEGQLRCGEHSDYGSITLLFQDSEGLQVHERSGEFISAPCIPGAILVNIADMMQRWTNDKFISVLHRVLLPPAGDSTTRQALAFFVMPDDQTVITCTDGSDKYPPVQLSAYLAERFSYIYADD
ncbi:uncharacterized protein LOC129181052 [Dunckerocampus dactyliophorus]|uniref:uncharacterized protein LOC129181052 n=1 Tax=Dunckerocampus dactyliophorus TaxID=161453 RepID=UPI0024062A17|nr:uncharacterized protein LOC129181052 [Dunckerocampus dactyliophorus]